MKVPRRRCSGSCTLLTVAALAGLAACTDPDRPRPTEPAANRVTSQATSRGGPLERFPEMLDFIPAVRIDDRGAASMANISDDELVELVTRAGGKVLIGFKPGAAARTHETGIVPAITRAEALGARSTIQALGAEIMMSYRFTSAVAATIPPQLAPTLRRLAIVDYVEPSFPGFPGAATMQQDTSWGAKKVRAHLVWNGIGAQSTRGGQANVTILDTGLDYQHLWFEGGDGPANTGGDCAWVATQTITSCYDDLTSDGGGHGPHVAGIISAVDNEEGFIGIAPNPFHLMSVRVCDDGGCPPENVLAGLDFALGLGRQRHIVNISIGFCANYIDISHAVTQLQAAGVLVVASAGNVVPGQPFEHACSNIDPEYNSLPDWATSVMFPARYSAVMAVSGTLEADQFAASYTPESGQGGSSDPPSECPFGPCVQSASCTNGSGSRYGPEVEIAAPFKSPSMHQNGEYMERCGTSMSAAAVSGIAALVWSRNPTWTATQVRDRLKSTAIPYSPAEQFGSGRVDAYNAVYVPPPTYTATITGPSEVRPYATCSFSANTGSPYAPYTYAWSVDGAPASYTDSFIYHTAGAASFSLEVAIEDAQGGIAYASHWVSVSSSAPECYDQ